MAKKEILSAEISVEDKASKQLDRIIGSIEKQTVELLKMQKAGDNAGKGMDRMTKSVIKQNNDILRLKATLDKTRQSSKKKMDVNVDTKKAVSNVDKLTRSMKSAGTSSMSMIKSLKGIGAAVVGGAAALAGVGYLGKQVFDATFVPAAQFEMNQKSIQALFNDQQKAKTYMDSMQNMALNSPLLNSTEMFNNSGMFVSLTKNQKQLEQIWNLTERLTARNPNESLGGGVFGAAYSLSSAFSGDLASMKERFNMNTKDLAGIGKLKLEDQIKMLDKYFKKMGMTKKLVSEMGDTTIGVWNQIKETTQVGLRKIGDPAVKIVKPMLDDLNRAMQSGKGNKFIKFGQEMMSGIAKGFVSTSRGLGKTLDKITSDPKYKKLSLQGKVKFVIEDIGKRFNKWYESSGKTKMEDASQILIEAGAAGMTAAQPVIVETALNIGKAVGKGIIDGAKNYLAENWMSMITSSILTSPITIPVRVAIDAGNGAANWVANKLGIPTTTSSKSSNKSSKSTTTTSGAPYRKFDSNNNPLSKYKLHAVGLPRVPRNNYPALLHEGEKVLTKQQANQSNKNSGSITIAKLADQVVFREEADMDKFISKLVRELDGARMNYGGAM